MSLLVIFREHIKPNLDSNRTYAFFFFSNSVKGVRGNAMNKNLIFYYKLSSIAWKLKKFLAARALALILCRGGEGVCCADERHLGEPRDLSLRLGRRSLSSLFLLSQLLALSCSRGSGGDGAPMYWPSYISSAGFCAGSSWKNPEGPSHKDSRDCVKQIFYLRIQEAVVPIFAALRAILGLGAQKYECRNRRSYS